MFSQELIELFGLPIISFHGSPGSPNDFVPLSRHLPDFNFVKIPRKGYPSYNQNEQELIGRFPSLILGYSWGCRDALEFYYRRSSQIRGIVLVSPFISNTYKSSFLKKISMSVPVLRRTYAHTFSKSFANEYIESTASPNLVPEEYRNNFQYYSNPQIFLRSIEEQNEPQHISYATILRSINTNKVPLFVVYGKRDPIKSVEMSMRMIKTIVSQAVFCCIEDAGHALLWTHTNKVAENINLMEKQAVLKMSEYDTSLCEMMESECLAV
jgi:pimeloyl-ACP methyl ester carboxylesterase